MRSRKKISLILLAVIATLACLILQQWAARARLQKQLAELQQQLTAQKVKHEEQRHRLQLIRLEWKPLRREERKQGDHWLPGELDRLRNRPLPAGEV
jgi:Tfp pilus assembly protein FimT